MTRLLTLLLLVSSHTPYAQSNAMNDKPPMIKLEQDKKQLIDQANEIINSKCPEFIYDPVKYDITVWANSKKVIIKYRRIIRFTPLGREDDHLRYDFEVDLSKDDTSPFDAWGMDRFYIPTAEEQEKINFVINSSGMPRLGFNNRIIEGADMYSICIDNEVAFGKYFIDKTTGKECMGSIEGSYAAMPDIPDLTIDSDPLLEIKE